MRLSRLLVMMVCLLGMVGYVDAKEVQEQSGEWPGMVHPREFKGKSVPTFGMSCDLVLVAKEGKINELVLAWDGHRWVAVSGVTLDSASVGGVGYVRVNPGPGLKHLMLRKGDGDGKLEKASIRCGVMRWFR